MFEVLRCLWKGRVRLGLDLQDAMLWTGLQVGRTRVREIADLKRSRFLVGVVGELVGAVKYSSGLGVDIDNHKH